MRPDATHFSATRCHNCGATLASRFCGQCGQERARRIVLRTVGGEAWQAWRWFELDVLRAAWRLLRSPGHVARDYVLGARKRHVHPLKLLLVAAGLLLLVLSQGGALLDSDDPVQARVLAQVRAWSNWSFSVGLLAMFVSIAVSFGGRAYNAVERLVLAVYAQFLVLCAATINHLPTLVWTGADFLAAHRVWSTWCMNGVGVIVLAVAAIQFFGLRSRADALRLLLAVALYLGLKWLLLRGYGLLVVHLVLGPVA